jgi:hypothetical protein
VDVLMEVTCRCGAVMRGTKTEIIAKVQDHGWTEHHQKLTPAEVRAVWRATEGDASKK